MATTTWVGSTKGGNSSGISLLTTELNALASGSGALSGDIDNTEGDTLVDLELNVTFGTGPTGQIDLYVARSIDDTTFEDAAGGAIEVIPKSGYVGSFYPQAITSAQKMSIPLVEVPPRSFKILLVNGTNQAFGASGHTLKGYYYNFRSQ